MRMLKWVGQRIEDAAQRGLMRAVSAPARRLPVPPFGAAPRRILVVRHDAIGDMVMSTGFFRRIKEHYPDAVLDVVAARANSKVLEGLPWVRRVFVHTRGKFGEFPALRRALRAERYDAVLDGRVILPKLGTDTAFVILASGAPRRVGIGRRINDYIYTDRVFPDSVESHFIDYMAALTVPIGMDAKAGDWRPELRLSSAERAFSERTWSEVRGSDTRLLVNISAGQPRRRWPDEYFIQALRHVRQRHREARILVMAPPWEFESAQAIAQAVGGTPTEPGLRDSFAVVADADILLTPDTSIAHVASAFQIPSVVLILEGMSQFIPYRTAGRCVYAKGKTLDALPVAPVLQALDLVLEHGRALEPECLPL
jgi:ADP-heptose:LPS heptosyltransferase